MTAFSESRTDDVKVFIDNIDRVNMLYNNPMEVLFDKDGLYIKQNNGWYNNYWSGNIMAIMNELDSTCGISDDELTERFKASIRIDDEIRRIKGLPVARYDDETRRAYLEYPDGRREYVGENNK